MRFAAMAVGLATLMGSPSAFGDPADADGVHPVAEAHALKGSQPSAGLTPGSARGPAPDTKRRRVEKGVIRATRYGERVSIRVRDSHGHVADSALKAFRNLMRQGQASFPADPRLLELLAAVSDRFGGKTLEIVSGYRAYTPTQFTVHSNHNLGRALDFKIDGVRDEDVWAFCRTFRSAGCGYYPNSGFVHLDVRGTKASWVDRSLPGEPPQYEVPQALAVGSAEPAGGE
jgi:uncharacterized protein YcbK (DUF882 family)